MGGRWVERLGPGDQHSTPAMLPQGVLVGRRTFYAQQRTGVAQWGKQGHMEVAQIIGLSFCGCCFAEADVTCPATALGGVILRALERVRVGALEYTDPRLPYTVRDRCK